MPISLEYGSTNIVILILSGVLSCFFGYRIFKVILGFWGFVLGFFITQYLFQQYVGSNDTITLIAGLVGGVVGVFLLTSLYRVGIFALGAVFGYSVVMMLTAAGKLTQNPIVAILAAVLGGIIAILMQRSMMILSTAFGGAWLIALGIGKLMNTDFDLWRLWQRPDLLQMENKIFYILFGIWLLLGIFGTMLQFRLSKGKKG